MALPIVFSSIVWKFAKDFVSLHTRRKRKIIKKRETSHICQLKSLYYITEVM